MLRQAYNAIARLHSREAVLKRIGDPDQTTDIRISPSSYFRNLEGPSQILVRGREFIIPVDSIVNKFSPVIKRGDRIEDVTYGSLTIDEITEMIDLGGEIMGYRVRTE